MVVPDGIGVFLFVNTDQPAFLFHADVARHLFIVADNGEFGVQRLKLGHGFSDEVMVGHGGHGQLKARPFAHLTRIRSARVDHMFAGDGALFGFHLPFTCCQLSDVGGGGICE